MAITIAEANRHIRHAIGGGELSPELSHLDVLNEAGEFLFGLHPWKFLERGAATLAFVADQTYVDLPSDFREVIGYNTTEGVTGNIEMTTHQALVEMRTVGLSYSWTTYVAVTHYVDAAGVPQPKFEVYPTPTAADANALTIFYRAGWVRLTDDSDVIPIPDYMRSLYLAIVRAFAQGYEHDNEATVDMRLAPIVGNGRVKPPLLKAAIERDAHVQPDYGMIEHGAADEMGLWRSLDFEALDPQ